MRNMIMSCLVKEISGTGVLIITRAKYNTSSNSWMKGRLEVISGTTAEPLKGTLKLLLGNDRRKPSLQKCDEFA